jgi:integrase
MQNPISDIEMPKVNNERVRYLSEPEYVSLFKALDEAPEKWLRPCVTIAIDTGLRLSNVCNLQWSEVNLFSRLIVISAEKMKNADYIGIPLTERACSTFKEIQGVKAISGYVFHDNGQRLYPKKVQRAFGKTLKAAGITNFHFHDLRHCYCSYLRQQGVDLHTIATLAGHKDLRMTKRYAHLNVDNLRDAIAKLESITNLSQSEELKDARAV